MYGVIQRHQFDQAYSVSEERAERVAEWREKVTEQ